MADINEKGASGSTKIAGSDNAGNETNFVNVTEDGAMLVTAVSSASDKLWDQLVVTRNPVTGDATSIEYKLLGVTVRTVAIAYDANEDIIGLTKS